MRHLVVGKLSGTFTTFSGVNPGTGTIAGFEAKTTIERSGFSISIQVPLEGGGGGVVGKRITLDIEAVLQA